mmetsp:Transcript_14250/g.31230  ORF Transcript_14250/g.31230 Transcript_14250/m.31230 type:complete len:247 (+) Transcript_14250:2128-2868(+)
MGAGRCQSPHCRHGAGGAGGAAEAEHCAPAGQLGRHELRRTNGGRRRRGGCGSALGDADAAAAAGERQPLRLRAPPALSRLPAPRAGQSAGRGRWSCSAPHGGQWGPVGAVPAPCPPRGSLGHALLVRHERPAAGGCDRPAPARTAHIPHIRRGQQGAQAAPAGLRRAEQRRLLAVLCRQPGQHGQRGKRHLCLCVLQKPEGQRLTGYTRGAAAAGQQLPRLEQQRREEEEGGHQQEDYECAQGTS